MKKRIIEFLFKTFRRKKYKLMNSGLYYKHLKTKTKNELIKMVMNLQIKISLKQRRLKKKTAKALVRDGKKRLKMMNKWEKKRTNLIEDEAKARRK